MRRTRRVRTLCGVALVCAWRCLGLTTPVSAQTINFESVGLIPGAADAVYVSGAYAYVAVSSNIYSFVRRHIDGAQLSIVDIANPSQPKLRGTVRLPDAVYQIVVRGSTAYVANGIAGLSIVDVANPDTPRVLGSVKTPGGGVALRLALAGSKAVVANRISGFEIIDVANPTKPVSVGSVFSDAYPKDVAVDGSVAYAIDSTTDLSVVDVSAAGAPVALSTQQLTGVFDLIALSPSGDSAQRAKHAYLLRGSVLQIYDISDPSSPKMMTQHKILGRARSVAIQGPLAYVASDSEGLQVIDLSNPAKPALVGSHKTAGPAVDVAVAGPLVFVLVGERVERGAVSNPTSGSPAGVIILRKRE